MFPFGETVTVVRGTGRDKFGDPLPGSAVEFDSAGWILAPTQTEENTSQAQTVTSGYTAYRESAEDIWPTDQIRVRGDLHEVVGRVRVWADVGIDMNLVRVTG
jgi:hypothetical protein